MTGTTGQKAAPASSWLKYLPPVLWEGAALPEQLRALEETSGGRLPPVQLGDLLRVFEKVLTGVTDDVDVVHTTADGPHRHLAVADRIARLERLFDPWRTPESHLPWLASWLALEFPARDDGTPAWDEFQRRSVLARTAAIHRQRGLRAGLDLNLAVFAGGGLPLRIAVDDGRRVLSVAPPAPDQRFGTVGGLVNQGPSVVGTQVVPGMVRPTAVAVNAAGELFVGDLGVPADVPVPLKGSVWWLDPAGGPQLTGRPPQPAPLGGGGFPDRGVVGVAVLAARPATAGVPATPETLFAVDRNGRVIALPAPYRTSGVRPVFVPSGLGDVFIVAMAADRNGDLLLLDRGGVQNAAPRLLTLRLGAGVAPATAVATALTKVREPLCLLVEANGDLLVGDGGVQKPVTVDDRSGTVVRVRRAAAGVTETVLLPPGSGVVAPTGLARTADGRLYAADVGLKPYLVPAATPFVRAVARPARVFRIDLPAAGAAGAPAVGTATQVTADGELVHPVGMVAQGDRLVVCDPGPQDSASQFFGGHRLNPHQFAVVVHFTESTLPPVVADRVRAQRQAITDIRTVVEQNKPAHLLWSLVTGFS